MARQNTRSVSGPNAVVLTSRHPREARIAPRLSPIRRYDRIRVIEIEESDLASVADAPRESGSEEGLRGLLRMAALQRGRSDEKSLARRRQLWTEILEHEAYYVTQKVRFAGVRQHGRKTVEDQDVSEVVGDVMRRLVRLADSFGGSEVGQFRKAIAQAVEWSVTDYARAQAKKRENEVAVDPGAFDPGSLDPDERPGFSLVAVVSAASAGERVELLEQLTLLGEVLTERERQVVVMRATGHSSKEVAEELGLSPANVDQIYHRSIKSLRAAAAEGGTYA